MQSLLAITYPWHAWWYQTLYQAYHLPNFILLIHDQNRPLKFSLSWGIFQVFESIWFYTCLGFPETIIVDFVVPWRTRRSWRRLHRTGTTLSLRCRRLQDLFRIFSFRINIHNLLKIWLQERLCVFGLCVGVPKFFHLLDSIFIRIFWLLHTMITYLHHYNQEVWSDLDPVFLV